MPALLELPLLVVVIALWTAPYASAQAPPAAHDTTALAKQTQNPVGDPIANWNAPSRQRWTVPVGFGLSRTTVFAGRPISLAAQHYYNVVRPDAAAGQQLRLVMSFLFPTRR